jgi:hypothetical protein
MFPPREPVVQLTLPGSVPGPALQTHHTFHAQRQLESLIVLPWLAKYEFETRRRGFRWIAGNTFPKLMRQNDCYNAARLRRLGP